MSSNQETLNINTQEKENIVNEEITDNKTENLDVLDEYIEKLEESDKIETKEEKTSDDKKKDKKKKKKKEKPLTEVEQLKLTVKKVKIKYKKRKGQFEEELEKQKEKYQYLQAELDNTRKHYIRKADISKMKAKMEIVAYFTPLLESFHLAKQTQETITTEECGEHVTEFMKGFTALDKSLQDIFTALKVKPIDENHVKFDYKIHEVMMRHETDEFPDNTVINILQKGYEIDGEVVKPAKVMVAKKPKPPAPPKPEPKVENEKVDKKEENTSDKIKPEEKEKVTIEIEDVVADEVTEDLE